MLLIPGDAAPSRLLSGLVLGDILGLLPDDDGAPRHWSLRNMPPLDLRSFSSERREETSESM